MASSPSSPSALIRTWWPRETPRASTASRLRAETSCAGSRLRFAILISDLNVFAALTKAAAGRPTRHSARPAEMPDDDFVLAT